MFKIMTTLYFCIPLIKLKRFTFLGERDLLVFDIPWNIDFISDDYDHLMMMMTATTKTETMANKDIIFFIMIF